MTTSVPAAGEERLPALLASRWFLAAALAAAAAVQALGVDGWFVFDDPWFLASARRIAFWEYVRRAFDPAAVGSLPEFDRYRPLWLVWFRLQYEVFGLHGAGYHVVAIALHLVTVVLVVKVARRLGLPAAHANLAGAIFAIPPAYSEAIAWVGGANRVVVAPPALASVLLWLAWVEAPRAGRLAGAGALFLVACLLHPSAVALVAVYPLLAWLHAGTGRASCGARVALFGGLPMLALGIVMAVVHAWVRIERPITEGFDLGWPIWANYGASFGMAAAPACTSSLGCYASPFREVAEGVLLAGSALFVAAAAATLLRWGVRSLPAVALLWFVVALAPDTTLVMGSFGRTMYLACVPFALWAAAVVPPAVNWCRHRWGGSVRYIVAALAAGAVAGSIAVSAHFVLLVRAAGRENVAFVHELREAHPVIPPGTLLVVEGAPANLTLFDDTRLQALVDVYYDGVTAASAARASDQPARPVIRFAFRP